MTMRDMFLLALKARGETVVKHNTKHIVLTYSRVAGYHHYIGSHGSLRIGRNVASSIPARESYKRMLLDEARTFADAMVPEEVPHAS